MRNRSKSCFVSPDEIEKENEKKNDKVNFKENFDEDTFENIISQIKEQIPNNDKINFEERIQKIKWKKVQSSNKSYKQIKSFFLSLVEKVRKHRILSEVIYDVTKLFENEKEKKKSDINEVLEKFHLDVSIKKKTIQRTPFHDFYDSVKEKVKYNVARKMFTNMGYEEKISWILKFLNVNVGEKLNLEQYEKAKEVLTNPEMALIDEYENKPKRVTPFNKFIKNYCQKIKESGTELSGQIIFKQAAEAWKNLPETEKEKLQQEANQIRVQYNEEFKTFLNTLPEDRRNILQPKDKSKIVSSKLKQQNIENSFLNVEQNKKDKKRKSSIENYVSDNKNSSIKKQNKKDISTTIDNKSKNKEGDMNGSVSNGLSLDGSKSNENKIIKNRKRSLQNKPIDANKSTEIDEPVPKKGKKLQKNKDDSELVKQEKLVRKATVFNMEKPPDSLYKYYKHNVHKGDKTEAKSYYKSMTETEKDKLSVKYQKLQKKFLRKYQEYLNTLSVEEVENIQYETNDVTKSSDESDYESDD